MENFTRQIIFGQRPVRRSDPKPGESEYYYFDPRGASTFDEMKTIDVPSVDSPNPLKDEIQNDLYANDAYNYRQLFGDTPPPKLGMRLDGMQPLNDENSYTTESAWNYPNNTQSSYYQKMGRPYDIKPEPEYQIGTLSGLMESNGNPSAIGTDNAGGPSYGLYQIATTPGTMNAYIKYLQKNSKYQDYANALNKAGGDEGAKIKSNKFANTWTQLSQDSNFNKSQLNFLIDTHLNPVIKNIQYQDVLNLENRHPVVKDALYSLSVQHRKASQILNNTLQELSKNYGDNISDELLLKTLYRNRSNYVRSLPESEYIGDGKITHQEKDNIINNRYPAELNRALQYVK